jgi:hypothetical protein
MSYSEVISANASYKGGSAALTSCKVVQGSVTVQVGGGLQAVAAASVSPNTAVLLALAGTTAAGGFAANAAAVAAPVISAVSPGVGFSATFDADAAGMIYSYLLLN